MRGDGGRGEGGTDGGIEREREEEEEGRDGGRKREVRERER